MTDDVIQSIFALSDFQNMEFKTEWKPLWRWCSGFFKKYEFRCWRKSKSML